MRYLLDHPTVCLLLLALAADAVADEPPVLILTTPLLLRGGETVDVALRGRHLENTQEVIALANGQQRLPADAIKIKERGKAGIPNRLDAKHIGDSHAVVTVTMPTDAHGLTFSVVTPGGTTAEMTVPVLSDDQLIDDKENNDGFHEAQPLAYHQTVRGTLSRDQDVDVFRLQGQAGDRIRMVVSIGLERGTIDPWLLLFNEVGQPLVPTVERQPRELVATVTLPPSGIALITVMDALDRGSNLHVYRLRAAPVDE